MEQFFQPGDLVLGKYRVERVLGRGGMGIVLAARHVELDELFAIKLLLPQTLGQPGAVERFVREARATVRLRSAHVARVVDAGRLEMGVPYMVMEHLDGRDLAAVLRSRSRLSPEEAAVYVLQACEAIAEAHAAGIVHRDIKPANLFLTHRANGEPCIKVLDFGISKCQGGAELDLTQEGYILGSPQYISPEQVGRHATADRRSDVWSMGVVLYRLVTGVLPFRGQTVYELISSVQQDKPPPPSAVLPGLPAELDAVIARALEKQPSRRFQSMEELAEALGRAVPIPPPAPRPTLPSLSSGAIQVAGLVAPVETTLTDDAPRRKQGNRRGPALTAAGFALASAGTLVVLTMRILSLGGGESSPASAPVPGTTATPGTAAPISAPPSPAPTEPAAPAPTTPEVRDVTLPEPGAAGIAGRLVSPPDAVAKESSQVPGAASATVAPDREEEASEPYADAGPAAAPDPTAIPQEPPQAEEAPPPSSTATPGAAGGPAASPSNAPVASASGAAAPPPTSAPAPPPTSAPVPSAAPVPPASGTAAPPPTSAPVPSAAPVPPASGTAAPSAAPRKKRTVF